jgi:HEAT repeat protein
VLIKPSLFIDSYGELADIDMSDVNDPDNLMGEAVKGLASRALTAEDPLTRKHAIYFLAMTRNPANVEIFIQALRDPEKAVRAQATRALADLGEPASERLITLLGDSDWKVRYRAAEVLGLMKEKRALSPLIRLLSDQKDHVRYMAAKSLRALGSPEAREALETRVSDENPHVKRMAESALTMIIKSDNFR